MKRILKYKITSAHSQFVELYENSYIMNVQVQDGSVVIWTLSDENKVKSKRNIITYMTGENYDYDNHNDRYIGTYQLFDGEFIGHVFERNE